MNICLGDISCKSCTPENHIKANDCFKVNFQFLHEGLFSLYYILKLELFCETATRYPRAFIVNIFHYCFFIPSCRGVIREGWWNFSISLKGLCFQFKPLLKFCTVEHFIEYILWSIFSVIWRESYSCFPVFGHILQFCSNTGKYGFKKVGTLAVFSTLECLWKSFNF